MEFDVVVVGASSAGLYAAELLLQAGKRVAIVEQEPEIRPARRTLIVTSEILSPLPELSSSVETAVTRTIVVQAGENSCRIRLNPPDLVLDRRDLVLWLAERVRRLGGEIIAGRGFQGFEQDGRGLRLRLGDGKTADTVVAREAVIGADGVFSQVARAAGIEKTRCVPIIQAEVHPPDGGDPETTWVRFDPSETRFFYWLIPQGPDRAVLGLVGDDSRRTRELLDRFLVLQGLRAEAFQSSQVALHHPRLRPWTRVAGVPVYLVGDAAGQVKVTTVGGTVPGLLGARAAAQAVLLDQPYAWSLRPLKRELDVHWGLRALLDRLDEEGYRRLVGLLTPKLQEFLRRHNRDRMAQVFWKLPLIQPRLLTLGLRCLWRKSQPPPSAEPPQPVLDVGGRR